MLRGYFLTQLKGVCIDFALRSLKSSRELEPKYAPLRSTNKFRNFLAALSIATICIFIRSIYRVAELSEGWTGHLIRQQWLFVGLEGLMVVVALLALAVFSPSFCCGDAIGGEASLGGIWGFKSRNNGSRESKAEVPLENDCGSPGIKA